MGIKKLFTFLDNNKIYKKYSYLNDLIMELEIDKQKTLVGVDGNLFCYKYTHSYDNMLIGFFNQVLKFLSNKIIPLYIFDGGTLQEKINTNMIRYNKKIISKYKLEQLEQFEQFEQFEQLEQFEDNLNFINEISEIEKDELNAIKKKLEKKSTKINYENISIILELFDILNVPYIFSHGEGEYLAVLLNKYNIIDFFLTDDTDPIPAGINKTIKFYNNSVYYLETKLIYEKLNLNKKQFCDFCILLGSDYATFSHGLKPNEIYNLILEYKSIEELLEKNKIYGLDSGTLELVNKIRNIYYFSDCTEKYMFLENKNIFENIPNQNININPNDEYIKSINLMIDHSNVSFYSNIILEFWDDFIKTLSIELNDKNNNKIIEASNKLKYNIYKYISKSKFNTKNIIKFIKNNIDDVDEIEIQNMITSFEFLNTFGI